MQCEELEKQQVEDPDCLKIEREKSLSDDGGVSPIRVISSRHETWSDLQMLHYVQDDLLLSKNLVSSLI